ncbi:hypothetical protein JI739_14105 [Ramlibacter sp. AW1]|uniref:Uncharacterized protein n=1 Tax=Ramlibacter aurantiacus TaxID=2801330 RepID=A0A936ZKI1_9BURK|nr:hypothetical protein [Ramlibacter aurantiacus]MBL0421487.1 hypothetical protein [Ramlibacter aurantiacus]
MKARRLLDRPIVDRALHASLGDNIDGPSLIRVPDWVVSPLGRYYLYFAHHNGRHIRLAYADALDGPWTVHEPGVLSLHESTCFDHIASPDVHVDHERRCIRMYFHGVAFAPGSPTDGHERQFGEASRWVGNQRTKLAQSPDGLRFDAQPANLGASYWRAFAWQGQPHALAMPGVFYRQQGGRWEIGAMPFDSRFRHCAVEVIGERLHVFFTRVGDAPERILHTTIDLRPDWRDWSHGAVSEILAPELAWEGADQELLPSARGPVFTPVRQLRDPALYVEDGRRYLLYAGAGEQAIGLAQLE